MPADEIKYPHIEVQLTERDGNAFSILAAVETALAEAGVSKTERDIFFLEAIQSDYNHLLQTCMRWVTVL